MKGVIKVEASLIKAEVDVEKTGFWSQWGDGR